MKSKSMTDCELEPIPSPVSRRLSWQTILGLQLNYLWTVVVRFLTETLELVVHKKCDRATGQTWWQVDDPKAGRFYFSSEQEVRIWLEHFLYR